MLASWPIRALATTLPALAAIAVAVGGAAPIRLEPGSFAWARVVRGAPDGLVRDGASVLLPGLPRERSVPLFLETSAGPSIGIGVDGGPLERARVQGRGVAARVPPSGTRGARLELRGPDGPLRLTAIEVDRGGGPVLRFWPALLVPPLAVVLLRRRLGLARATAIGLVAAGLMVVATVPVLDWLVPPRALAYAGIAAASVVIATASAADRRRLMVDAALAAAFVFGLWIRVLFLPSAGSWDTEYWKAWTARADSHGVARVYGNADAVPPGHLVAQMRGQEPLWLVPYRGRDFVVDYPPLAMALWRASWRATERLAPRLEPGEAENAAVKLPAVLGDAAAVVALVLLFGATRRGVAIAAAYWALPVSWLSSGVLGFLDGALAVLVVAALVAAGRGRPVPAGIALALAALVKPTALVVGPAAWCALAIRRASIGRATAAGLATVAVALVPFLVAGTLQTAIVHVYRILFQGTLSGGFPNVWWLLGHALRVARVGDPLAGPAGFAKLDLLPFPARPLGTLAFLAACVAVWRWQRTREGVTPACLAGALLVLAYGVLAVGVHENHPHPLFLLLGATGLPTRRLRALAGGCALVYVANMLLLSGLGRFYGPRYAMLEPLAHALASARMALGFDLTLALAVVQVALFAWALARTSGLDGSASTDSRPGSVYA